MAIRAVLFDFSGTLFRLEEDDNWLDDLTDVDGRQFDVHAQAELMRRMTAPLQQSVMFDGEGQHAWENRDLDPALHRKAYLQVLRKSGVPTDAQANALYERLIDPAEWTPYPDAGEVLKNLAAQDIKIAVVSNIAFDLRPSFGNRGWDGYVDEFILSFEVGAIKPDPTIFETALARLGIEASESLMIGDSEEADGGAVSVGCSFALVEPLPTQQRPDALLAALSAHGLGELG